MFDSYIDVQNSRIQFDNWFEKLLTVISDMSSDTSIASKPAKPKKKYKPPTSNPVVNYKVDDFLKTYDYHWPTLKYTDDNQEIG